MRVHINIGSNLGDRAENLARARELLREFAERSADESDFAYGIDWRESSIIESEPWGYESENRFLNRGVSFESWLTPIEILHATQEIERRLGSAVHRNADGSYADRAVDIDIIFYGSVRINTPELTLPHPRYLERDFVLQPIREIDPDWLNERGDYPDFEPDCVLYP